MGHSKKTLQALSPTCIVYFRQKHTRKLWGVGRKYTMSLTRETTTVGYDNRLVLFLFLLKKLKLRKKACPQLEHLKMIHNYFQCCFHWAETVLPIHYNIMCQNFSIKYILNNRINCIYLEFLAQISLSPTLCPPCYPGVYLGAPEKNIYSVVRLGYYISNCVDVNSRPSFVSFLHSSQPYHWNKICKFMMFLLD